MFENSCKFVHSKRQSEDITIINFVYEKIADFKQSFIYSGCHCIYLVTEGKGILHTANREYALSYGNLFFTFASKPFYIENSGDLQYLYISFIGLRPYSLFERLGISYISPVYNNFSFLRERWINDFENSNIDNIDLKCESLLLHTLSFLCRSKEETSRRNKTNGILELKTYVDMHYTDSSLNLKSVSQKFNYSYKYASNAFKSLTRISFSSYLCNIRLDHAQRLLQSGVGNIQEIAFSSGFSDAQYFSKSFKKRFMLSPTEYRKSIK